MRILQVLGSVGRGGAQIFVMNVYRVLARQGVQFDFLVSFRDQRGFADEIEALGGRIFVAQQPSHHAAIPYTRTLLTVLTRDGPYRAVHSHILYFSGYVLAVARALRVPVRIAHCHTAAEPRPRTAGRSVYCRCMRRLIHAHSTQMLGCSTEACEFLYGARPSPAGKIQSVKNAVSVEDFLGDHTQARARILCALHIPQDAVIFLHIGSFSQQKNHTFLVELFRNLAATQTAAYLLLAGDGPLRPSIEAAVKSYGLSERVTFLGIRSDIPDLLAAANLLVLPSIREGVPVAVIEAQAAGVPVLASSAVSPEADCSLGLLQLLPLREGPVLWARVASRLARRSRPGPDLRRRAIIDSGFDVASVAGQVRSMYAK